MEVTTVQAALPLAPLESAVLQSCERPMSVTRKIIKVFLASPSDLGEERRAAKATVEEFNSLWADDLGYQVDLVGWEDTVTRFGRPQAAINLDLARCELFVGMLWKKWGTPPDSSDLYTSGFHEEFCRSVDRRVETGRPEITLLFKQVDAALLNDPGPELRKVLTFKTDVEEKRQLLFESFSNTQEFDKKLTRIISNYVQQLRRQDQSGIPDETPRSGGAPLSNKDVQSVSQTYIFQKESSEFLANIAARFLTPAAGLDVSAVEAARLSLVASTYSRSQNDERVFGVHNANLIFENRNELQLSRREIVGLLFTGLELFSDHVVPVWHWYKSLDGFNSKLLTRFLGDGETEERQKGAIECLTLLCWPLSFPSAADRSLVIKAWLSEPKSSKFRVSALNYLADFGEPSDLPTIMQELERNDTWTRETASEAALRVALRESRFRAINLLNTLQLVGISAGTLDLLFSSTQTFDSKLLSDLATHAVAQVRRFAVTSLKDNGALTVKQAERLLTDEQADMRMIGLTSLQAFGRVFSNSEVEHILKNPPNAVPQGIITGLSLDQSGSLLYESYERRYFAALDDQQLQAAIGESSVFSLEAVFAFLAKEQEPNKTELRTAITDRFRGYFNFYRDKLSLESGLREQVTPLESHMCQIYTQKGLEILCGKDQPEDIELVRSILEDKEVNYFDEAITFLEKHGDATDVPLLVRFLGRRDGARVNALLSMNYRKRNRLGAQAILKLEQGSLSNCVNVDMPNDLLTQVILNSPRDEIVKLSNIAIIKLFSSEFEELRKVVCLRCLNTFSKPRLAKLQKSYSTENERRFYNIAHWLDFGISTPQKIVSQASSRLLKLELANV